jgi:hypothetical protein
MAGHGADTSWQSNGPVDIRLRRNLPALYRTAGRLLCLTKQGRRQRRSRRHSGEVPKLLFQRRKAFSVNPLYHWHNFATVAG